MFFDYYDDEKCCRLGEQYMFGDDILFAPIVERGQTEKKVYLPEGSWVLARTKEAYEGGKEYTVKAEIDEFVAFVKEKSDVINCFI